MGKANVDNAIEQIESVNSYASDKGIYRYWVDTQRLIVFGATLVPHANNQFPGELSRHWSYYGSEVRLEDTYETERAALGVLGTLLHQRLKLVSYRIADLLEAEVIAKEAN